jgi:calcineurin-like phosphoesterase family protein
MTTFFIGDTHFGHKNILMFGHRNFTDIEAHDEALIQNWNKKVNPKDVVYHLGDVAFSKEGLTKVGRLNGVKKLVMGNHDQYPTEEYLKYFTKLYGAKGFDKYLLTHIPVATNQFDRYPGAKNIHGHLHHNSIEDDRYINVSCEQVNFTPIALEELPQ